MDIRWIQRLDNWTRALAQLTRFMEREELNELEEQGLIQSFEYNHELAWKTLRDFLIEQGETEIHGSRDAAKKAFAAGLLDDGEVWMDMVKSRNLSVHTYDEETKNEVIEAIVYRYYEAMTTTHAKLVRLAGQEQGQEKGITN